jgi:hypothetical protein
LPELLCLHLYMKWNEIYCIFWIFLTTIDIKMK